MTDSKDVIKVGYWHIRGLAAPLRMMCEYKGAKWENITYELKEKEGGGWDASAWFAVSKPKLKERNPLINLPYVDYKAKLVSQTDAIIMYLASELKLDGGQTIDCIQLLAEVMDLRNSAVRLFYGPKETYQNKIKDHCTVTVSRHHTKMENWLKSKGSTYLLGDKPTAPDFHLWEMIDQHEVLAKSLSLESPLKNCPRLAKLYKEFRSLKELQTYFDGPASKYPINNKMANFGNN
mmetsp:Transcript_16496/g.23066  ORF Transcript_16496/g.23066 Transcript_16496/m.23066 type:complete len:235 (-) Transcript_16496:251-955(-)|eukprot:CAMPEP_0184489282 /NCGR_PEP_ID=MMETSP0113_2-20130426/14975_1 /TAXON_ID=91329 /ORGANISM="Norrisiella sphaerica, Strain BC52" /LENGTH=234 /DNA_ID=CAMNT_0026872605 /DNA_START=57 /DNA_END=761 /DNA_ORIENTATION=+